MKLNRKNKKAFTIVELVIVIGVIGILSAILIPTFANLTNKANEAKLKEELAGAYTAYVTDVADGYYGEPSANPAAKMYSQSEVAFLKGGKYYTYDNGWNTTGSTTKPTNYSELAAIDYNGFRAYANQN